MKKYILRRIIISLPMLLGISIITFTFINLAPGDPISAMIDPEEFQGLEDAQKMRVLGVGQTHPGTVRTVAEGGAPGQLRVLLHEQAPRPRHHHVSDARHFGAHHHRPYYCHSPGHCIRCHSGAPAVQRVRLHPEHRVVVRHLDTHLLLRAHSLIHLLPQVALDPKLRHVQRV